MMMNHRRPNVTAIITFFVVLFLSNVITTNTKVQSADLSSVASTHRASYHELMRLTYDIGAEIGHPETMQAILLQESNGGRSSLIGNKNAPVGKRSYGPMQVQVIAARDVLKKDANLLHRYFPNRTYGSLIDEEIIALLLSNPEANIRIAAHHLKNYLAAMKGNWDRAIAGYNMGLSAARRLSNPGSYTYVVKVKTKLNEARKYNNL